MGGSLLVCVCSHAVGIFSEIHHRYVGILILGVGLIVFDRVLMIAVWHKYYAHDYVTCRWDCEHSHLEYPTVHGVQFNT